MGSHVEKYYTGSITNTIHQNNLQMLQRFKNEICRTSVLSTKRTPW